MALLCITQSYKRYFFYKFDMSSRGKSGKTHTFDKTASADLLASAISRPLSIWQKLWARMQGKQHARICGSSDRFADFSNTRKFLQSIGKGRSWCYECGRGLGHHLWTPGFDPWHLAHTQRRETKKTPMNSGKNEQMDNLSRNNWLINMKYV